FWLFGSGAVMKWTSLRVSGGVTGSAREFYWCTPLASTMSWEKRREWRPGERRALIFSYLRWEIVLIAAWMAYRHWVPRLAPPILVQGYLAALIAYLLGQA